MCVLPNCAYPLPAKPAVEDNDRAKSITYWLLERNDLGSLAAGAARIAYRYFQLRGHNRIFLLSLSLFLPYWYSQSEQASLQ